MHFIGMGECEGISGFDSCERGLQYEVVVFLSRLRGLGLEFSYRLVGSLVGRSRFWMIQARAFSAAQRVIKRNSAWYVRGIAQGSHWPISSLAAFVCLGGDMLSSRVEKLRCELLDWL